MSNERTFMTAKEAAEYLGFSVNSLYNKCYRKQIPHYKPSAGKLYFKKEELDEWIQSGRVATDAEIIQMANNFSINQHN